MADPASNDDIATIEMLPVSAESKAKSADEAKDGDENEGSGGSSSTGPESAREAKDEGQGDEPMERLVAPSGSNGQDKKKHRIELKSASDVEITMHVRKPLTTEPMLREQHRWIVEKLLDPDTPLDFRILPMMDDIQIAQLLAAVQDDHIPMLIRKSQEVFRAREERLKSDLTFRNLCYRKGQDTFLSGVSGFVARNTMTCVLGAPDAGITTLMKTLAGRHSAEAIVSGEILLDGQPVDVSYGQHVGYIPKDDLHYPTLTVRETLRMSARMRVGNIADIYLKWLVELILKFLGLGGVTASTIVGDATHRGISGGQKRRVSIATEYVAGHSIVLADLLTNGLDSTTAFELVHQMAMVSRSDTVSGRAYMISLVQPSPQLLNLFDMLLLMSKGRSMFFGPLRDERGGYPVLHFLDSHGFVKPPNKSVPDFLAEISYNPVRFHRSRLGRSVVLTISEQIQDRKKTTEEKKVSGVCVEHIDIRRGASPPLRSDEKRSGAMEFLRGGSGTKDSGVGGDSVDRDKDSIPKRRPSLYASRSNPAEIDALREALENRHEGPGPSARASEPNRTTPKPKGRSAIWPSAGRRDGGQSAGRDAKQPLTSTPPPTHGERTQSMDVFALTAEESTVALGDTTRVGVDEDGETGPTGGKIHLPAKNPSDIHISGIRLERKAAVGDERADSKAETSADVKDDDGKLITTGANEREVGFMYLIKAYKHSEYYTALGQKLWADFEEKMPWEKTFDMGKFATPLWFQTYQCLKREWIVRMRDKTTLFGKIFQKVFVALILGTVFLNLDDNQSAADARVGLIFILMMQFVFGVMEDVPDMMHKKRVYFAQEAAGYYHGSAYYIAQQLIGLPFHVIELLIFMLIAYPMAGLNGGAGGERFWFMYGCILLMVMCSHTWALFICSLAPNETTAQAFLPVTFVLFMLMCGYMIPPDDIPVYWNWMHVISFLTYGFRALMLNEFLGLSLRCDGDELVPESSDPLFTLSPPDGFNSQQVCGFTSGDRFLTLYDMENFELRDRTNVLVWLFCFYLVFNVLAFWGMVLRHHELGDQEEPPKFDTASKPRTESAIAEVERASSYIEWRNLSYDVVNPKTGERLRLLNNVKGYAAPGDMVALMGPSGAGKSTLLDVIAQKKTTGWIEGDLLVNGRAPDEFYPRIAGYVEQFDSHIEFATVEESVAFSAMLRLDCSEDEVRTHVENAMESVQIGHVRDHIIGNIESGGISPELRKKTAIAVELVIRPTILFLDEPTTGLDSVSAMAVVDTVAHLADLGLAVVCTVHQPSAELFSRFRRILMLQPCKGETPGGRVSYFGNVKSLESYCVEQKLGRCPPGTNVADFALDALGNAHVAPNGSRRDPADVFEDTKENKALEEELDRGVFASAGEDMSVPQFDSVYARGIWFQFKVLMKRSYLSTIRDEATVKSQFGAILLMAILVGSLYLRIERDQSGSTNRVSLMFLTLVFIFYTASYKMNLLVAARPSFSREKTSNTYQPFVYYMTQMFSDAVIFIPRAILFTIIVYFMTGLNLEGGGKRFWGFLGMLVLIFYMSLSVAELFAFAMPNITLAQGVFQLSMTIFSLFCGFLVKRDNIPDWWIWLYYGNFITYPINFFVTNELEGLSFSCPNNEGAIPVFLNQTTYVDNTNNTVVCDTSQIDNLNCFRHHCPITSGNDVLDTFSMDESPAFYAGITILVLGAIRVVNMILFTKVSWVDK